MNNNEKIGLALSGGGYRATLFGLGTLIRLNEFGILRKLSRITSVSGGSILNGYLAMRWNELDFDQSGVAQNFDEVIVKPIYKFCSETTLSKVSMAINLINPFASSAKAVRKKYEKSLFGTKSFAEITKPPGADQPQFLFYGTSFQTGASVRMVDSLLYDYNIGAIDISDWSIATVVGISSAFPPVLSPVTEKLDSTKWVESKYQKFFGPIEDEDYSESDRARNENFKSTLKLCDGGLYDNLGIECLWKKAPCLLKDCSHDYNAVLADDIDVCLVSDAGAPLARKAKIKSSVASQLSRLTEIMGSQQGALRKRFLISKYIDADDFKGTYWGITTTIENYEQDDSLTKDNDITRKLRSVPTVLTPMSDLIKSHLINWSYALSDSAIQEHCSTLMETEVAASWPMKDYPL